MKGGDFIYTGQPTALKQLDGVIADVVAHISDFTKSSNDFTRNRKLNATTTIKVTLNMQGNSLNTELIDAFPNLDDRMTASAYVQQKAKLTLDVFKYILMRTIKRFASSYNARLQSICNRRFRLQPTISEQICICNEYGKRQTS